MEHDMELISLWPSVESRLKMLDIITVRVHTISVVAGCSHSDKESYKNLRQSILTLWGMFCVMCLKAGVKSIQV